MTFEVREQSSLSGRKRNNPAGKTPTTRRRFYSRNTCGNDSQFNHAVRRWSDHRIRPVLTIVYSRLLNSAVRKAFLNFGSVRFGFAAKTAVFGSVRFSKNNRGSGRFGSVFRDVWLEYMSIQLWQGRPLNVKHDARCIMVKVGGEVKIGKKWPKEGGKF